MNWNDLEVRRKSRYRLKVSLLGISDTIGSLVSEDESFLFSKVPTGQYQLVVEKISPSLDTFIDSGQQWVSPAFRVTKGKITMLSSHTEDIIDGIKDPTWCIYQLDHSSEKVNGAITLDFRNNELVTPTDSLNVYLSDKYQPNPMVYNKFGIPSNKLIQIPVKPGFYELSITFDRVDPVFSAHYSPIYLNIQVLPTSNSQVTINEFKEFDSNVYLFMTTPTSFFNLYNECVK